MFRDQDKTVVSDNCAQNPRAKSNEITQFNIPVFIYIFSTNINMYHNKNKMQKCVLIIFNTQDLLMKEGYSQEITKQQLNHFCLKT